MKISTGDATTNPNRKDKITTGKTTTGKTTTGNRDFDAARMRPKGIDDKPDKAARGSFVSMLGDVVDGVFSFLLDPNTLMTVGYLGAGVCLSLSVVSMQPLAAGFIGGKLGLLSGPIAAIAAVGLAAGFQFLEILPRLHHYFPNQGNKLVLKLSLNRVFQGKERTDTPSLLPKANRWAKTSHETNHAGLETASAIAYLLELVQALSAFSVFVGSTLNPVGVFSVIAAVFGFELCLGFCGWMKAIRLTSLESRRYNEIRRRKRLEAEKDL
jgi:hypothetical protein